MAWAVLGTSWTLPPPAFIGAGGAGAIATGMKTIPILNAQVPDIGKDIQFRGWVQALLIVRYWS